MFGASIVRAKRERERKVFIIPNYWDNKNSIIIIIIIIIIKERLARGEDPPIIPYIKPFGPRFDASQLPYFKYRQAVATLGQVWERWIVLDILVTKLSTFVNTVWARPVVSQ